MPDSTPAELFKIFNEIGIIEQLGRALLEARLPDGLIAPHFTVLNHLVRVREGDTPLRMARAFQVPKTSLAHTLKMLAARGLIEMRPNPEDGRSKTVWLTPAGRALRDQTIDALAPDLTRLAGQVDLDKLLTILPVLTELRQVMDADRN